MPARRKNKTRSTDTKDTVVGRAGPVKERTSSTKDRSTALENLEVGQLCTGVVKSKTESDAHIDLGGIDAVLPLAHIARGSIAYKRQTLKGLKLGGELTFEVIDVRHKTKTVIVGLREQPNRWIEFAEAHPTGTIVVGTVSNVRVMYALVDFGQGVEGFLHVDHFVPLHLQILQHHNLRKYLQVGDVVEAVVKEIDAEQPKLVLQLDSQEFAKFDKRIVKRHPTDEDMDFEVKGVIEAAQTLRDASKEALQIGLPLAELDAAKSREIAEDFLEVARAADIRVDATRPAALQAIGKLNEVIFSSKNQPEDHWHDAKIGLRSKLQQILNDHAGQQFAQREGTAFRKDLKTAMDQLDVALQCHECNNAATLEFSKVGDWKEWRWRFAHGKTHHKIQQDDGEWTSATMSLPRPLVLVPKAKAIESSTGQPSDRK